MAPNIAEVERQTALVIKCLFGDDTQATNRNRHQSDIETDGPEDNFDPVLIADKLRQVADALNEDVKFKAALKELKQAAAQEALEQVLSNGVDALCQTQVGQRAEIAPEMQIIKATVALSLSMIKSCPEVKDKLQNAVGAFLNRRVGPWVAQQGGWDYCVRQS